MRMWMINPKFMCDRHLLGEHGEIHKFIPTFQKAYSIKGRMDPIVQIQIDCLKDRHDRLAKEMLCRGMNHKSPIHNVPDMQRLYPEYYNFKVDKRQSVQDLSKRCIACKTLMMKAVNYHEYNGNGR